MRTLAQQDLAMTGSLMGTTSPTSGRSTFEVSLDLLLNVKTVDGGVREAHFT
jgi:hypothetical protein